MADLGGLVRNILLASLVASVSASSAHSNEQLGETHNHNPSNYKRSKKTREYSINPLAVKRIAIDAPWGGSMPYGGIEDRQKIMSFISDVVLNSDFQDAESADLPTADSQRVADIYLSTGKTQKKLEAVGGTLGTDSLYISWKNPESKQNEFYKLPSSAVDLIYNQLEAQIDKGLRKLGIKSADVKSITLSDSMPGAGAKNYEGKRTIIQLLSHLNYGTFPKSNEECCGTRSTMTIELNDGKTMSGTMYSNCVFFKEARYYHVLDNFSSRK